MVLLFPLTAVLPHIPVSDKSYHFSALFGNEQLKSLLINELENGKLTHALLLEGAQGTGRRTLVRQYACALACTSLTSPCGICRNCKRILADNCPDVVYIGVPENKKTISVDQIRDIRSDAYIIPGELDFKMYVVNDADKMTPSAQNAFLKILEEPPSYVYFVLICESAASLLPTVKSRTQNLRMEVFSQERLEELLLRELPAAKTLAERDRDAFEGAVRRAKGSYGQAIANIKSASRKKKNSAEALICTLLGLLADGTKKEFYALLTELPTDREEYRSFLDLFLSVIRDAVAAKNTGHSALTISEDDCEVIISRYSEKNLAVLFDTVFCCREDNESNTNINLSSANLMFTLWESVRGG